MRRFQLNSTTKFGEMFAWICASLIGCSIERRLKNQRQISKKQYFKNYCSFDKGCKFSALQGTSNRIIWKNRQFAVNIYTNQLEL